MVPQKISVLIVDDEQVVCDVLHDELSERGYLCTTVLNGDDAIAKLAIQDFEVVLLDIRLPGMSGIEVLRKLWLEDGDTAIIMITAINDVNTAVEAMKLGASDYIVKPFDLDRVAASIGTALETRQAAQKSPTRMDAIAVGVEAKLDPFSNYSKLIAERTIDIARQLGIAEEEIQQWVAAQAELDAEKAMTEANGGGKLTIRTQQVKEYIRVSLADDGPGIAAEHFDKLFNPFFTTRGEKGGTGLGLSVCHGIIAEHGGKIYGANKPGKGTIFFVELPLATEEIEESEALE